MRREVYNGHRIVLYDSIDNLPADRFEDFNIFFMLDAGIGGDMESVDSHITKLRVFNAQGDKDDVELGLLNMRTNMSFVLNRINPKMYCFYALLKEINGREVKAITKEDVDLLRSELMVTGITMGKIRGIVDELKKKWMGRLNYFSRKKRIAQA